MRTGLCLACGTERGRRGGQSKAEGSGQEIRGCHTAGVSSCILSLDENQDYRLHRARGAMPLKGFRGRVFTSDTFKSQG